MWQETERGSGISDEIEQTGIPSPIRAFIQENYEIRILRAMAATTGCPRVLEIGCGNGTGTKLIKKYYCPQIIVGVDLDEAMIRIAARRNSDPSISHKVMDASKLEFPDGYFDAIFDFGIIHHIPNWRETLREMRRVLKPGGELILEDLSIASFSEGIGLLWRILSDHPYQSMYKPEEFQDFLNEIGFVVLKYREANPLGFVKFFSLAAVSIEV